MGLTSFALAGECGPHLDSLSFDRTSAHCYYRYAGWSSPVARWAHNPKVGGSNPPPATNAIIDLALLRGSREGALREQ